MHSVEGYLYALAFVTLQYCVTTANTVAILLPAGRHVNRSGFYNFRRCSEIQDVVTFTGP